MKTFTRPNRDHFAAVTALLSSFVCVIIVSFVLHSDAAMSSEQRRKQQQPNDDYDGEPGCRTLQEVNKMYRNYWDPTAYWHCEAQTKPAALKRCPPTQLFLDAKGHCVNYTDWYWTEPSDPPSKPATDNTH